MASVDAHTQASCRTRLVLGSPVTHWASQSSPWQLVQMSAAYRPPSGHTHRAGRLACLPPSNRSMRVHHPNARDRERGPLEDAPHGYVRGVECSDDAGLSAVVVNVHHLRQQVVHATTPLTLGKHSEVDPVLATA